MTGRDKLVLFERDGPVARVTLNHPERLNAFGEPMARELISAFDVITADTSIRAVALFGAGRSFMAGGDITAFRDAGENAPSVLGRLIDLFHPLVLGMRNLPIPVVAGIQGAVAGGGFSLALACDLVVAAQDLKLTSAYGKLATSSDGGLTWNLTRLVGPRRALEIMWLNDPISADAALGLGLVNRVVPSADLERETIALAQRLAGLSAQAVAAVKALVNQAPTAGLPELLDAERASFVRCSGTQEFRDAVHRFFARKPH